MNPFANRARPIRGQIIRRLRWLLLAGVFIAWLGTLLFSIGLIGYCTTLSAPVAESASLRVDSPLLVCLPIGFTGILVGGGFTVVGLVAGLLMWARRRPIKRLLFVAAILGLVVGLSFVLEPPRLSIRGLNADWPGQSIERGPMFRFRVGPIGIGLSPNSLVLCVGYSTIGVGSLWAWPPLLALPASLLCVPWIFFWPVRVRSVTGRGIEPMPITASDDRQRLERRLRRMLWTATVIGLGSAALEVVWYLDYIADYPLSPTAAEFFLVVGQHLAGGLATISLGAVLAAATGLVIARVWRFDMRSLLIATAVCSACLGVVRFFVGERLTAEHFTVSVMATVEPMPYGPGTVQLVMRTTNLRVPVIEPFSLLGPGSLLLLAMPFVMLPGVFKWRARLEVADTRNQQPPA